MKVIIDNWNRTATVIKEDGDARMSRESTFYYHLAKQLSKQTGKKWIRKEMYKDGHMVDSNVFYATMADRKVGIYDPQYAIQNVAKTFNKEGKVVLAINN